MSGGAIPPLSLIRQYDTHRLILSKYTPGFASVLTRIAGDDHQLQHLFDLDHATNERLMAENGLLPGIGYQELLFGIPNYRVINAAFTHAHPLGSRFSGPERGAWYSAFELETAQSEVAFHKTAEYREIGRFEDSITYDDYLSDFSASFHDLRESEDYAAELDPDSYAASQALGERLLLSGSLGMVYPSVRRKGGTCVACFRPAVVSNVRQHSRYRFTWSGSSTPTIS